MAALSGGGVGMGLPAAQHAGCQGRGALAGGAYQGAGGTPQPP